MNKETLRRVYLEKRCTLSSVEVETRNESIKELFFQSTILDEVKVVHIFLPIRSKVEVDTWRIINFIRKINPEIKISIPRVIGDEMESVVFENLKQLRTNKWGILEPLHGEVMEPSRIDLMLVPLIIFDRSGFRIGYGKGYYDKYISNCKPDVMKVGLSLLPPVDDLVYTEAHDIKMDACVTGNSFYQF